MSREMETCWACDGKGKRKVSKEATEAEVEAHERAIMHAMLDVLTESLPPAPGYGAVPKSVEQDAVSAALLAAAKAGSDKDRDLNKERKKAKLPSVYVEEGNILASAFCAYLYDNEDMHPNSALGDALLSFAAVYHALESMSGAMAVLEDYSFSLSQASTLRGAHKAQAAASARALARWEKQKARKAAKKPAAE